VARRAGPGVVVFPLRDDFEETPLAPDVNRSRPGPLTLEQFAWLPGAGLGSATAGLFGQNRWGLSLGFARPLAGGAWLLDAQLDATGFWAASDSGLTYSEPSRTSGHLGVTWRPPLLDVALRLRGARYLYGDQGSRWSSSARSAISTWRFFALRTDGVEVAGVRLGIPVPPLVRPAGRFRVIPPERINLVYRDQAAPFGTRLDEVASREAFLRQLSRPSLAANRDRLAGGRPAAGPGLHPVSWVGMTGFVTTPGAASSPTGTPRIGYAQGPRRAAWDHRGSTPTRSTTASLGFLPRVEVACAGR